MPKSRSCTLFMRSRGLAWCSKNNSGRIVGSLCLRLRVTTLDRSPAEIVRKGDRRDARQVQTRGFARITKALMVLLEARTSCT